MNILNFLRSDSPWSSLRVANFLLVLMFVPTFVWQYAWRCHDAKALVEIPPSNIALLAILLGLQVGQKYVELLFGTPKQSSDIPPQ